VLFWSLLALNVVFPILYAPALISFNMTTLVDLQKETHLQDLFVDIASIGIGVGELISAVFLIKGTLAVRKFL
jgi:hypothetical protein